MAGHIIIIQQYREWTIGQLEHGTTTNVTLKRIMNKNKDHCFTS